MNQQLTGQFNPPRVLRVKRHPVKLTALLYLVEALKEERYEECAEFVAVAREFGAQPYEIQQLLEDLRRRPRG
jgi:hypothetical protein